MTLEKTVTSRSLHWVVGPGPLDEELLRKKKGQHLIHSIHEEIRIEVVNWNMHGEIGRFSDMR